MAHMSAAMRPARLPPGSDGAARRQPQPSHPRLRAAASRQQRPHATRSRAPQGERLRGACRLQMSLCLTAGAAPAAARDAARGARRGSPPSRCSSMCAGRGGGAGAGLGRSLVGVDFAAVAVGAVDDELVAHLPRTLACPLEPAARTMLCSACWGRARANHAMLCRGLCRQTARHAQRRTGAVGSLPRPHTRGAPVCPCATAATAANKRLGSAARISDSEF